jgi:hypothetical protein
MLYPHEYYAYFTRDPIKSQDVTKNIILWHSSKILSSPSSGQNSFEKFNSHGVNN